MERKGYNSKKKALLVDYFKNRRGEGLTARDIIEGSGLPIGEATVYRLLARLSDEGLLTKSFSEKDNGAVYRYNETAVCRGHIHLKCVKCDDTICLDAPESRSLEEILGRGLGFDVDDAKTTIYGVCRECREDEKE